MRDNPINALRETLRCGFAFRKSRLESLCVLVFGVFVARSLSHLACHFPGRARSRGLQHLWAYPSLDRRAEVRAAVNADADWQVFVAKSLEMIEEMQNPGKAA